mgnify:CR=1 FL=1
MKKHADATTNVLMRTLFAGNVEGVVVILLYSMEPSIMEHMRIAKIRPKGRSVRVSMKSCDIRKTQEYTIFRACKLV